MVRTIAFAFIYMAMAFFCAGQTTISEFYPIIVTGKVTLEDGSAPPFSALIQRKCSDPAGDAPGPLTNKKGEWTWRLQFDAFDPRACVFQAVHAGYKSSTLDATNINLNSHDTTIRVPPIVLTAAAADPYTIYTSSDDIPGRARGPFGKAMKALDMHQTDEARRQLEAAVAAAPKFAEGWHALGVVNDRSGKTAAARDAYMHAIEADPKLLPPYVTLARLCIITKDWQCAAQTADRLIKMDPKHTYAEIYLHRAVAQYELKDLAGAEQSAQEFMSLDPKHTKPRAEYVIGRILEAKGDSAGAREHISKYLELQPGAPDAELVQGHLLGMGKPGNAAVEPELEPL